jgi:hypothetical protein
MTQLSKIHTPAQRAAKVLAIGIVAFSGISAVVAQADAQSVFASPNTEAGLALIK